MRKVFLAVLLFTSVFICRAQTATDYYNKGVAFKNEKKVKEAADAFKEAIALDPDYKEALYELGWCQNDLKDYTGAVISLRKARTMWAQIPKVHFELGYAFEKTDKIDSASASYKRCLELKPDYSLAYKQLGTIAYNQNDNAVAAQNFKKYEEYSKLPITDYLYWYRRGYVNNALKNFEEAKTSLTKSLEFKKDYTNTYLELGFACKNLKQNDEAISNYKKAMELEPKSHVPLNGIGEVYRDNFKNMDEAMIWYQKVLDMNVNERKANFGMGYCLNAKGKYSEAIPYLKKAIEQEATYTAAYVELGYSYYMTSNSALAIENLNKAIGINYKNENSRYYLTLIYISQSNKTLAQKMVDELKVLNSKYVTELQEKVNKM